MSSLFVTSRSTLPDGRSGGWGPIGRLEFDGQDYLFCYTQGARTLRGFQPFYGMSDLEAIYRSSELFPLFANRLLSSKRPEYEAYLRWSGFEAKGQPDPVLIMGLLGVTEGRRQTDQIEVFPCPAPSLGGSYENKFFLHGVAWMDPSVLDRVARLNAGEQLYPMLDPFNLHDPNAVAVRTQEERAMIGYVPRYLAPDVHELIRECGVDAFAISVDRVNHDAPMQQRVLCRLSSCWPASFRPCSDDAFRPIPAKYTRK